MRTIEVYLYSELTEEKAKQKAKKRILHEIQGAAPWVDEYRKIGEVCREKSDEELLALAKEDEGRDTCPLTGFCADIVVLKAIREASSSEDITVVALNALEKAWGDEQASWEKDAYIEEDAEHNEYYFTKNGIYIGSKL
jgi:glutamine amidotransferase PdxT